MTNKASQKEEEKMVVKVFEMHWVMTVEQMEWQKKADNETWRVEARKGPNKAQIETFKNLCRIG